MTGSWGGLPPVSQPSSQPPGGGPRRATGLTQGPRELEPCLFLKKNINRLTCQPSCGQKTFLLFPRSSGLFGLTESSAFVQNPAPNPSGNPRNLVFVLNPQKKLPPEKNPAPCGQFLPHLVSNNPSPHHRFFLCFISYRCAFLFLLTLPALKISLYLV